MTLPHARTNTTQANGTPGNWRLFRRGTIWPRTYPHRCLVPSANDAAIINIGQAEVAPQGNQHLPKEHRRDDARRHEALKLITLVGA